jgi:CRISPR type I-F-associated protein Csy2
MKDYHYVHLKNFWGIDANAMAGFYTVGLPAMTGFSGFCHVIQRYLKEQKTLFSKKKMPVPVIQDFMLIINDMQLLESHPKHINYQHGRIAGGIAAATVESPLVHLEFDLILRIDLNDLQDPTRFIEFIQSAGFLEYLFSLPFCGGNLKVKKGNNGSSINHYASQGQLNDALKLISPESFVIGDATEDMEELMLMFPEKDTLDILLDCISREKTKYDTNEVIKKNGTIELVEDKNKPLPKEYKPLYLPLAVGYAGLDEPHDSPMSRYGHQHIMAESLIGLGRAWNMGTYRRMKDLNVWWCYQANETERLYRLKGLQ